MTIRNAFGIGRLSMRATSALDSTKAYQNFATEQMLDRFHN